MSAFLLMLLAWVRFPLIIQIFSFSLFAFSSLIEFVVIISRDYACKIEFNRSIY